MPHLASLPLGVFDSGVGGLTVLRALRRMLPLESFLYLGDTARVPYGSKPIDMVRGFADEIAGFLLDRGVKGIVVACNTASAASLPGLAERLPVPVWGVIEPGVAAAMDGSTGSPSPHVGVLGTVATIAARVYQDHLEAAGAVTWARACPLFVPIVEEGISDSTIARLVAEHYLADRPALDAVILGCTHYPALKPVLAEVLGPDVRLIDSAEAVAATVRGDLVRAGLAMTEPTAAADTPTVHYLVTGDREAFLHTARVLAGPAGTAEHVVLSGKATRFDRAAAGTPVSGAGA
ncbi:MAG: glutamate racemase [Trueperaceae bacterium]